jgi:hypothetical protein
VGEGLRAEESRPDKHGLADGVFILPLPPPINDGILPAIMRWRGGGYAGRRLVRLNWLRSLFDGHNANSLGTRLPAEGKTDELKRN